MDEPAEKPASRVPALLALLVLGGSAVGIVAYQLTAEKPEDPSTLAVKGFDFAKAPESDAPAVEAGSALAAAPRSASLERMQVWKGDMSLRAPSESAPAAAQGRAEREKSFLRTYGGALGTYQSRLAAITGRYYKNYPVVRQVDADFARIPAYMEVLARYKRDRDPFAFARDAIAVPEVRQTIRKYLSNPEAWAASMGMMREALRNPPPDPIFHEAKDFMLGDPQMSSFVRDFAKEVPAHMPLMMKHAPPPGPERDKMSGLVNEMTGARR